jgi:uncharacterized protein YlxW (UPF0749 family)
MKIINWETLWSEHWKKIAIGIVCILAVTMFWRCDNSHKIINNVFDKWKTQVADDWKEKAKASEERSKQLQEENKKLTEELTSLKKEREGVENEISNIKNPKTNDEIYKIFVSLGITPIEHQCVCK